MSTKWSDIVKDAANSLLEMFKTGKMPEAVALTLIKRREGDDQPSFSWSLGNQILMFMQGTSDARGFRQWEKVGRRIQKGAKALYILAPIIMKRLEKNEVTGIMKEHIFITGFKPVPVFRVEDTYGEELTKPDYTPKAFPPFWGVAEYLGIEVEFAPGDRAYGTYNPTKNKIVLCSDSEIVYYHELSHAIHYQVRDLKPGPSPEKEIVAETSAAILCHLQEIEGYESQAFDYVKEYASRMNDEDVVKAVMKLLGDIEAVVLRIIEIAELVESPQVAQSA